MTTPKAKAGGRLHIECDMCGNALTKPGGLLFSPPFGELQVCEKFHLCKQCYRLLLSTYKDYVHYYTTNPPAPLKREKAKI